ncbi:alpha/beta fold hydrolase [Streptomyces cavernicola]|uniref:Alpha/beta hydrolase n=1 Tax=Streptomyces cavernicola TaxID=3043613 RepID=A0ABT6S6K0_9ACTN|nr:alpha/beta hydrolase [Streptomyces sp. B-S-A6]MDI3403722.1 alpha/beta hydrolase [Streptomyces sp. B-S-A6]
MDHRPARHHRTEHFVEAAPGTRLWVEECGPADAEALLLIMGAQTSGLGWPDALVDTLAEHCRVIRYDHRDTGRSSRRFNEQPYAIADLAVDAVAVLDALGVARAHVVGLSLGGLLAQLLVADHPDRLLSATLIGTSSLSTTPYVDAAGHETPPERLPGTDPRLLALWAEPPRVRSLEEELAWRVEHWRLLSGEQLPFDAAEARALERRIVEHTGHHENSAAHAHADPSGLLRTEELAATDVPVLVVAGPAEPVFPPPHAQHLAQTVRGARLVEIPGMGHALPRQVLDPLAAAILAHAGAASYR